MRGLQGLESSKSDVVSPHCIEVQYIRIRYIIRHHIFPCQAFFPFQHFLDARDLTQVTDHMKKVANCD